MTTADRIRPRATIMAFAREMERRMRDNDHKGGWERCRPSWCLRRSLDEIGEAFDLLIDGTEDTFHGECADAANFLMFAATNHRRGGTR
jgi:hypothetical protein